MDESTRAARFAVLPDRSVVLVSARSNVGPIEFGMTGIEGSVEVTVAGGALDLGTSAAAALTLPLANLRSGNQLYDAELFRRIDARRYPTADLELATGAPSSVANRYQLNGVLTFHGVRRDVHGSVEAALDTAGLLVVDGEQVFDTRDFDIPTPSVLMLRIYPDVKVQLHVEAEPTPTSTAS
jgi:polyisoprenoid-binding protein YceI